MSLADKLTEVAENVPKVYAAGESAGRNEIISIHPEKTVGGSYISANYVSELPHSVKCKVTGVDNPETVTVTRCGKNLLNPHNWSFSEIVKYNSVDCVRLQDSKDYSVFNGVFKENTRYTFTFKAYREAEDVDKLMVMLFEYTDGTYDGTHRAASSEIMTITSTAGKTVSKIKSGWNHSKRFYLDLSVSCLHEGATASEYEPYNVQTLTPSADGTVEGMTSISPQMNIFTDNADVMLDVTYRQSKGMQTEYDMFWDDFQDNGNRTNYNTTFAGRGWSEKTLNPKYVVKPIDIDVYTQAAGKMFFHCNRNLSQPERIDFRKIAHKFDFSETINANELFQDAEIDYIDIALPKAERMNNAFYEGWGSCKTHITLTVSEKCTSYSSTFDYCYNLTDLIFTDGSVIAASINIQYSPLTLESATSVINALKDYSGTDTAFTYSVTFSSTTKTLLDNAGAIFNGLTWIEHLTAIGWNS